MLATSASSAASERFEIRCEARRLRTVGFLEELDEGSKDLVDLGGRLPCIAPAELQLKTQATPRTILE
jgi:hypothetical protein